MLSALMWSGWLWVGGLLVGWALLLGGPATARAYVPPLEELYRQIDARRPGVNRVIMETRSEVFDPLGRFTPAPADAPGADAPPPEAGGRAFRTKVYWIRDRFLGVEVFSLSGKRLYVYVREGPRAVSENFDPTRTFKEAEVLPVYLPFLVGDPAWWRRAAGFWGVTPRRVDLVRGRKGEMLYRLEDDPDRALWVRPETLNVTRIDTALGGGDRPGRLTFEFAEFVQEPGSLPQGGTLYYPLTINVLMDRQLIRRTRLRSLKVDPSVKGFPITRMRKDADRALAREKREAERAAEDVRAAEDDRDKTVGRGGPL